MPQKLLQVVMLACLVGGAALAADTRRKAIRREMIEMDIAVRNLTSTIAMADRKVLDDSLQRLVTWQIKDHPDLGAAFRQVLADWQSKNLSRYGTELQKEAQALRSFAAGRAGRLSDSDWAKIGS
ncbi:MAG TPA: hypothetical protein PKW28_15040, partial [Turneriella sp.]|nr:hypothetical protein [Turneriella sp.]